MLPLQLTSKLVLIVEPELLMGVPPKAQGQLGDVELLLKWKTLPEFEAIWKDFYMIQKQFPEFHLEDKVNVWALGGDGMPQVCFKAKGKSVIISISADV